MKLVDAYSVPNHVNILWNLLLERQPEQSISHHGMPTMQEHTKFVGSRPYAFWYIIRRGSLGNLGSVYLTRDDEIGVFIYSGCQGHGYGPQAIKLLMKAHPRKQYLANINPANAGSIHVFEELGFKHVQNTYTLEG